MDSAENQKAEIERIKQAVNQNFRSRRAFRVSKKSAGPSRSNPAVNEKQRDATSNSHSKHQADWLDENISSFGNLQLESLEGRGTGFPQVGVPPKLPDASGQTELQNPLWINASESPLGVPIQEGEQKVYPFLFHKDAPPAENEHDLTLIMNYLDNVFPLQFYFYQPSSTERGRGWLLSLLLRAKSSYFTALAFSSLHQLIFVHKGDIIMEQRLSADLDKYHIIALSELQKQLDLLPTTSGYEHLKMGVEILACMIQLMSIEVFRETKQYTGWKDDWEVHLQGAETLLFVIGTDLRTSSVPSPASTSSDENLALQSTEAGSDAIQLPLNEIAGLDLFTKAYIWGDVIRCASIGLNTSDVKHFPYLAYLEEDRIRLDHVMGCRNWAMIAIKEISNLESWKKEMQSSRTLSIPLLSRRAAEIEQRLHDGLESVFKNQTALTTLEQECNFITELYALSALTYLAIIVSGNYHLLPEISSSATKGLKALKALPPHLLIRISWAYCVAGCMAAEDEKDDFRNLLFEAHGAGHLLGTLWNGLELMEEFWILRENMEFMKTAEKCAWALAMDTLGAKILLI